MRNIKATYLRPDVPNSKAAVRLVQLASSFSSQISISIDNKILNAKSILGVLSLGLKQGDCLTISASGQDEDAAAEAVCKYIENGFED